MSNTGFHGYGKAWRLSDVTSVLRLGFRYKASIYIARLKSTKRFIRVFQNYFVQRHLNI